jgi:hypothetical protein
VDSPETRVRIQNTTTSEEVGPDGETWHANGTPYLLETGAFTEWRQYTALFRTTAGHAKTDTFRVILAEVSTGGAGSTIDQFMDDVAIGRADPCVEGETCDEDDDVCVGCSFDADCDDGVFCNGEETCVEGLCQDPLRNGSLDTWAEGVPVYWKKSQQAGTAERESDPAEVRPPGGSAASFTRDADGSLNVSQDMTGFEPETWYQISWWWRASADVDSPQVRLRLQNLTTSEELGADGETWHPTGSPFLKTSAAFTNWRQYTVLFRTAATHMKTDTFRAILAELNTGDAASTITQFLDDVAVDRGVPCMEDQTCNEDDDVCVEEAPTLEPPAPRTTGRSERRDGDR